MELLLIKVYPREQSVNKKQFTCIRKFKGLIKGIFIHDVQDARSIQYYRHRFFYSAFVKWAKINAFS